MGSKNNSDKITGQKYYQEWCFPVPRPTPEIVKGKAKVIIEGVAFYGEILCEVPIYQNRTHIVFRMGAQIYSALAIDNRKTKKYHL